MTPNETKIEALINRLKEEWFKIYHSSNIYNISKGWVEYDIRDYKFRSELVNYVSQDIEYEDTITFNDILNKSNSIKLEINDSYLPLKENNYWNLVYYVPSLKVNDRIDYYKEKGYKIGIVKVKDTYEIRMSYKHFQLKDYYDIKYEHRNLELRLFLRQASGELELMYNKYLSQKEEQKDLEIEQWYLEKMWSFYIDKWNEYEERLSINLQKQIDLVLSNKTND